MITIEVRDMSCSHCVATLSKALCAADPTVRFHVELERKQVSIESSVADAATLLDAVRRAGYDAALLPNPAN